MSALRLFAVFVIFVLATVAWAVLGTTNMVRTDDTSGTLTRQVGELWGERQVQQAPRFVRAGTATASPTVSLEGTDIEARFKLDQRRRGLLWYATYAVDFAGTYKVKNTEATSATVRMSLALPTPNGVYNGLAVRVDGKDVPMSLRDGEAIAEFPLAAGATAVVKTGYATQGLDEWRYEPSPGQVGVIKDLNVRMTTDFTQVDYPTDAVSPTKVTPTKTGMDLAWQYTSLVSGRPIALVMPKPANPGPLASRISFFAPVSLLFFFAALILLTATSGVKLHPVHYGFLAAAFFAFQLLFSYMVDRVDINLAFAISSVVSVALVLGYLSIVVGRNRALLEIGLSQFVFLVLFSYSLFFEGLTGLAVTIGSVLTLGFFMAKTAKVDWETVFRKAPRPMPPAPPQYAPPAQTGPAPDAGAQ
ncbi:MAG: inner membrane CreD family protein [Coriobacteriia bacterium]|nr:inner membrane CreD family protein [Coriobacteriia bacterium]